MLTICGGLFVVCGSKAIGFPAAGALGCAVLSVTANASWKSSNQVTEVRNLFNCAVIRLLLNYLVIAEQSRRLSERVVEIRETHLICIDREGSLLCSP